MLTISINESKLSSPSSTQPPPPSFSAGAASNWNERVTLPANASPSPLSPASTTQFLFQIMRNKLPDFFSFTMSQHRPFFSPKCFFGCRFVCLTPLQLRRVEAQISRNSQVSDATERLNTFVIVRVWASASAIFCVGIAAGYFYSSLFAFRCCVLASDSVVPPLPPFLPATLCPSSTRA